MKLKPKSPRIPYSFAGGCGGEWAGGSTRSAAFRLGQCPPGMSVHLSYTCSSCWTTSKGTWRQRNAIKCCAISCRSELCSRTARCWVLYKYAFASACKSSIERCLGNMFIRQIDQTWAQVLAMFCRWTHEPMHVKLSTPSPSMLAGCDGTPRCGRSVAGGYRFAWGTGFLCSHTTWLSTTECDDLCTEVWKISGSINVSRRHDLHMQRCSL